MAEEIPLAVIGRGPWGGNYVKTIRGLDMPLPDTRVLGRDYHRVLTDMGVLGVVIATSASSHFDVAMTCMTAGLGVLIEKPMVQSTTAARALECARDRTGVAGMVGHIQLYDEVYRALKSNLHKVGQLKLIEFHGQKGTLRPDSDALDDWGPHPTYLFSDLAGRWPQVVACTSSGEHNVTLDYSFGKIAGVARINLDAPVKTRSLTAVGSAGILQYNWGGNKKSLTLVTEDQTPKDLTPVEKLSPLTHEVLQFVECIRSGVDPLTPLSQGVAVVGVMEALRIALEYGAEVTIPHSL